MHCGVGMYAYGWLDYYRRDTLYITERSTGSILKVDI